MRKITSKIFGVILFMSCFVLALPLLSPATLKPAASYPFTVSLVNTPDSAINPVFHKFTIYNGLNLKARGLSEAVFQMALRGYFHLMEQGKIANDSILTIIDFSKPSTEKRLFVVDVRNMEVLFQTYVAHGMNSGTLYARKFSNVPRSNMSSPGFYLTSGTYMGQNGYSLRLEGLEKGINDNARRRAIVMHGADYASTGFIDMQGYLGRSYGCPAVPRQEAKPIIETIKDGSCMFIYSPSKAYKLKSKLI